MTFSEIVIKKKKKQTRGQLLKFTVDMLKGTMSAYANNFYFLVFSALSEILTVIHFTWFHSWVMYPRHIVQDFILFYLVFHVWVCYNISCPNVWRMLIWCKRLEAGGHISQIILPFCSSEFHKPPSLEPRLTCRAQLPPVVGKAVHKCAWGRASLVPSLGEFDLEWILFQGRLLLYWNTKSESIKKC